LGQKLLDKRFLHHVLDSSGFKDGFLFFRFFLDEDYTPPDSLNGGITNNWRFLPHIRANSIVLNIALAEDLERSVRARNKSEVQENFMILRHMVKEVTRRDAFGWTLVKTARLPVTSG
jgi:hypothetical protein